MLTFDRDRTNRQRNQSRARSLPDRNCYSSSSERYLRDLQHQKRGPLSNFHMSPKPSTNYRIWESSNIPQTVQFPQEASRIDNRICYNPKATEQLASDLREQGLNAKAFHAGLKTALKTKLQDEFMSCDDIISVATIAFWDGH